MKSTVLVLGSGPIRIGQGIEFDYSCVHCVWALREMGYRAVIINNNPETVSTDFDTGDGLYFEPVNLETVERVYRHEQASGIVVQFGGQTAINLAQGLERLGLPVLGTSPNSIAAAEDRDLFDQLLTRLGIPKPPGRAVRTFEDAAQVALEIGYPVLVRPSFVLGGRAMEIVFDEKQLVGFYKEAEEANPGQPVLVDKYVHGIEAEVDVICDGKDTLVAGIMEHIERAGVHSGDSMAVYPPVSIPVSIQRQMVDYASEMARELQVKGLMNVQFVLAGDEGRNQPYVIEVNPRGSRTVPYLSKVTDVPMVKLATRCMMGECLENLGYSSGLWTGGALNGLQPEEYLHPKFFAVKAPVFSFQKLAKVEPSLGPEMKSTGEILGIDFSFETALYKALIASGIQFKKGGIVLLTVNDADKPKAIEIAKRLESRGYRIGATAGTHDALTDSGVHSTWVMKINEGSPNLLDLVLKGEVSLLVNSPSADQKAETEAAQIRRACIETGVACVTNIDTAAALARALEVFEDPSKASCLPFTEYVRAP